MSIVKTALTGLMLFTCICSFAQSKIKKFFSDHNSEIVDSLEASSYVIHRYIDTIAGNGTVEEYDINGTLQSEREYANIESDSSQYKKWTREGISKSYYPDGNLKFSETYLNNKLHGSLTTYFPNGQLKRSDVFDKGKFVSGQCYSEDGEEIDHYDFQVAPEYEGGMTALYGFIMRNLSYPSAMSKEGIRAKIFVRFIVTKTGEVAGVRAMGQPAEEFKNEAERVVKLLKKWTPGKIDGEEAEFTYTLPIAFKIN